MDSRLKIRKRLLLLALVQLLAFMSAVAAPAIELQSKSTNDDLLLEKLRKNKALSQKDIAEINGAGSEYPKIEIEGLFQMQYRTHDADAGSARVNEMYLPHVKLSFTGSMTEALSLVIEPEYGRGQLQLADAYVAYRSSRYGLFAGNHLAAFGAEALKNDVSLRFADRSPVAAISPDRLVGASALASWRDSKLLLQGGIWNGGINGQAEADLLNNRLAESRIFSATTGTPGSSIMIKAARLSYSSNPRRDFYSSRRDPDSEENFSREKSYGLGLSFYSSAPAANYVPASNISCLNGADAIGMDAQFKYKRLSAEVEFAKRNLDWWQYDFISATSTAVASKQESLSLQAGILLTDRLSFVFRQDSFVYDSSKVLKGPVGQDEDTWTTVGLNYYFRQQHAKIQANYTTKSAVMPAGVSAPEAKTAQVQATVSF